MKAIPLSTLLALTWAVSGCATQDFVRETVAPVQTQVTDLSQRVKAQDDGLKALDGRVRGSEERILALQKEAQARAAAAGQVREPGFAMSTLLSDDKVKFAHGRALLTPQAQAELNQLLDRLRADNKPVFLEIQGHTDASGPAAYNHQLGLQRADAVRQHLALAGMPLVRMATISYGETAPMANNRSAEGRRQNRRVQVVVMR
jgi:outer membrane protein OmpA-like peptidoglycan-associated protein